MQTGLPRTYYGLHMTPGVAEYRPKGKDPFRVYVNDETIRKMGPTFSGRPVFVGHRLDADPSKVNDADGVVVESFFNKADGCHWAKFMVFTEAADQAIKQGLRLSNMWENDKWGAGGQANGVQYDREALDGEYNHLAIVRDPRYENSIILTPEEFKQYNQDKEAQLLRLANSKKGESRMGKLQFWKREKLENSLDMEETLVMLPKSKKEKTISQLVNEADEAEMEEGDMMANSKHHVMFGNEKMTVEELVGKHQAMCNELSAMKAAQEDKKDNKEEQKPDADKGEEKMANEAKEKAEKEEKEKMANSKAIQAAKDKAAEDMKFFNELDKADDKNNTTRAAAVIDLPMDKVQRGKDRYGSPAKKA